MHACSLYRADAPIISGRQSSGKLVRLVVVCGARKARSRGEKHWPSPKGIIAAAMHCGCDADSGTGIKREKRRPSRADRAGPAPAAAAAVNARVSEQASEPASAHARRARQAMVRARYYMYAVCVYQSPAV